jgi:hypothetical protein
MALGRKTTQKETWAYLIERYIDKALPGLRNTEGVEFLIYPTPGNHRKLRYHLQF